MLCTKVGQKIFRYYTLKNHTEDKRKNGRTNPNNDECIATDELKTGRPHKRNKDKIQT